MANVEVWDSDYGADRPNHPYNRRIVVFQKMIHLQPSWSSGSSAVHIVTLNGTYAELKISVK